jgi:hypothetical protein
MSNDTMKIIAEVLSTVFIAVLGWMGVKLSAYFDAHANSKQVDSSKKIAGTVVLFAEQVAKRYNWSNRDKLTETIKYAGVLGDRWGIHLSDADWQVLIEEAVRDLKKVEGWAAPAPAEQTAATPTLSVPQVATVRSPSGAKPDDLISEGRGE